MPTFSSMKGGSSENPNPGPTVTFEGSEKNLFVAKTFGVMFIAILITALAAIVSGLIFGNVLISEGGEISDDALTVFFLTMVGSALGLIILSIVIPVVAFKGKRSVLVPFIIYTVLMGLLLSTFVLFVPWYILGEAAVITSISFGIIALIGYVSKGKIPGLGLVIIGLLIGILLLTVTNLLLMVTGASNGDTLDWVISFAFLALIMFVSIFDVARINSIASKGAEAQNNLVLYSAFVIYTDVINLFIRIVYLLSKLNRK